MLRAFAAIKLLKHKHLRVSTILLLDQLHNILLWKNLNICYNNFTIIGDTVRRDIEDDQADQGGYRLVPFTNGRLNLPFQLHTGR